MLDDLELELVQKIDSDHDNVLHQTGVPGLDGDFLANQGRRATRFTLSGVVAGEEAAEDLKKLRDQFAEADPVPFVSDISTATRVDNVLIEELGVREIAGKAKRFEYSFTLREFQPAPEPEIIPIEPPPPVELKTTLEVEVVVDDDPSFTDFGSVTVTVDGTDKSGAHLVKTLTNRTENVWTEDPFPPGRYRFEASEPGGRRGAAEQEVIELVDPNHVTIHMRGGASVGNAFVVHYSFDRAFVEPCMREVLQEVHERIQNGPPDEKILIVGHTDKSGSNTYNQSLSERRARGVFAYLTFADDPATAINEWDQLRRDKLVNSPTINDNWSTTQYQYMLQDLGFFSDWVNGVHGDTTSAAVRSFQSSKGLPPSGVVDDATWLALIEAYLRQDAFSIPRDKFLPNCPGEILKWIGCGESDPAAPQKPEGWRPNRRTELIFVQLAELPCKGHIARPDTFALPPPNGVGGGWCMGPASGGDRACFLRRSATGDPDRILVEPVSRPPVNVKLRIEFEDGTPAAGIDYFLIAPDGEFMDGEFETTPGKRGTPHIATTGASGEKQYNKPEGGKGIWTLEVQGHFIVRLKEDPPGSGKGNVVCKRMEADGDFIAVIGGQVAAFEFVDATNVDQTLDRVVFGQPCRLRADLPNETRDEITVELMSFLIRRP
jgi:outer membrane protein OmpA-like peptidoglycan-associated protein